MIHFVIFFRRFKTKKGMYIHKNNCQHKYVTTEEVFVLLEITAVFGHKEVRWLKVWWGRHEKESIWWCV